MKNLKKVLALVLVVAMMASFAVSASAASFTDNDKIVYNDAVKLLSTLEVVNGFTDGSFNPEGNVTRAQTAKMIAYIMNGGADASSSFASSAKFNDVANGYWAANSIGYCATKEIVAGAGNNLYYPNNDVTGVQLAKMALVALGYDPTIEKLTGSAWAINTINLAEDAGLFDDMNKDFNASAAASRQEAAQILYNMLLSEMVCYTDNGTNIIIGDITINTDATRKYMKADGEGTDKKSEAELAVEEYFDLTGTGKVTGGTDDYGRPARVIDVKGVDSITLPDDADLTYDGQVTAGTLYSNLGNDVRDYAQSVWIDGDEVYAEKYGDNGKIEVESGDDKYKVNIKKNDDTKNGAKGATMEVYIDKDAEAVTFVIINTYLAQVDSIDENKDDENLLDIDFNVFDLGTITLDEQESFGYEEDDYVLVTVGKDGSDKVVDVIGAPETIEGTASRIGDDYYTVDGTKYSWSAQYHEDAVGSDNTGTYTFYLDKQGNVIGTTEIEAGAAAGNYLYVTASQAKSNSFDNEVKLKASFTDGTDSTIYLPTRKQNGVNQYKFDGDWKNTPTSSSDEIDEGWYSYTKSDNTYTLKKISSDYVAYGTVEVVDLLSGKASIGEYTVGASETTKKLNADSSTKLYLADSDLTYTGYKNFPDSDKVTGQSGQVNVLVILSERNGKTASEIYVIDDGKTTDSVDIAMYAGDTYTGDNGDYGYFYTEAAVEDGTDLLLGAATLEDDAVYTLDGNDKDGYDAKRIKHDETNAKYGTVDGEEIYYNVYVGKVTSVKSGDYFYLDTFDDKDASKNYDKAKDEKVSGEVVFYEGYDDDDKVMFTLDGDNGTSAKISKNDIVKVVYITVAGDNYALAAFVMD